jgi:hypothetical protein
MVSRAQYLRTVEEHLRRRWGSFDELELPGGPMKQAVADFRVLKFQLSSKRRLLTFATRGMSDMSDAEKLECFIFSPEPDNSLCELLTVLAWYHRTGARLGLGHTVNFGRPWLPQSLCSYGLFSLPYLDGPELEWLDSDGIETRFLWLIPITLQERDFKMRFGLDALESRFESAQFDFGNPYRQSIVNSQENAV